MVTFPASPSTNQYFPDPPTPGLPQWRWDGSRWRAVHLDPVGPIGPTGPAGATGDQGIMGPANPPPNPLVDWTIRNTTFRRGWRMAGNNSGNDAITAGDVGQYAFNIGAVNLVTNFNGLLATLQLTAGDWMVSGQFCAQSGNTPNGPEMAFMYNAFWDGTTEVGVPGTPGEPYTGLHNFWTNVRTTMTMPLARVTRTTTGNVGIWVRFMGLAQCVIWGAISARRVR